MNVVKKGSTWRMKSVHAGGSLYPDNHSVETNRAILFCTQLQIMWKRQDTKLYPICVVTRIYG